MGHKRNQEDKKRHKGNPVAKHMREFNMAHTFINRKSRDKKGHVKHKGEQYE